MKIKSILILLIFVQEIAISQTLIKGKVTEDDKKTAIIGATIYFPDLKIGTITDTSGNFSIGKLPKGKLILQISAVGYEQKVLSLNASDENLQITLGHSAIEIQGVVVTGVSTSTEIKRNPVPIAIITPKYLQQNTATNVIDAISKIPGVSNLSTGPNISKPYIRGLGYNRVLTLFDGIRQDGQQWGDEHGIEVDQYLVDRIEVIKGPASLMYGSDALAGVVNLLPIDPLPVGQIRGDFTTNFQTNNLHIGSSLGLAGNSNGVVWGFRASHKQAADYQNKFDGRVYNTKYNETDINAHVGLNKKWGYSNLNFSLFDDLQEIPDGSRDSLTRKFTKKITEDDTFRPIVSNQELSSYSIGILHQHVQHYRIYSASNFNLGESRLGIKLGYQTSIRQEFSHPEYPTLAGLRLILNIFTYDIKYFLPSIASADIVVGLNGMMQTNKNTNASEFVIPNYSSLDIGPFVHAKKSFNHLDFSGGVRFDVRSFQNDALYTKTNPSTGIDSQVAINPNDATISKQFDEYSHSFSGFSGSLGATYNFEKNFSLKANLGRGYRAPNISEISSKGIHPGTGFLQLGDTNFEPEFNLQGDLGLLYFNKHISISIEMFYNYISNYIFNQKLIAKSGADSVFVEQGVKYPVFKFQQTNARILGGEVSIDYHPIDWLHFENAISVLYAENLGGHGVTITDGNRYLPLIPPLHTMHEVRAEFSKKKSIFLDLFIKIGVQYYAAQNRIFAENSTETPTPSYTLIDVGIGSDLVNSKGKKVLSWSINGTNLADIAYQSNMSRLKYFDNYPNNFTGRSGIYNMGRNISFKLTLPF